MKRLLAFGFASAFLSSAFAACTMDFEVFHPGAGAAGGNGGSSGSSGSGGSGAGTTGCNAECCAASDCPAPPSCADGRVELVSTSRLEDEHHLVAILRLSHQTVEDGFGLGLHVADHRAGKVGQVLVGRQFDHLGVDEDEPHSLRALLADESGDEVVDENAFA